MKKLFHNIVNAEIRSILAFLVAVGCFSIVIIMMFHPIPTENKDLVNIAIGALLTGGLASVVSFYFGAVKGEVNNNNSNTQNQVNKTVFWGIPSSNYGQLVTHIDGVAVQGQVTVQNLPNYDSSFSFVQEYNSTNMVLTRNGLAIAQLTLNNGQSVYNVNSVICEWNGTRPIRPPR